MKKFLLSILCCLMAVVNGYAQGSDDFGTYFTKANNTYTSGTTAAGWKYANAAILSIDNTYAPTINGKTSAKGTITSPTLAGGCGTLSLKYACTYSESNGVSFKVTIKQRGANVASYDVKNTKATQNTVYKWEQVVNVEGDFEIYITNNSPSNSSSKNKDRFSIWNIEWTAYGQASVPQLDAPVISPESCTFVTETFDVTISAEDGATVYYTLDGSNPTVDSNKYNGGITLTETTTVKAFAVKDGYKDSEVVEATYTKRVLQEGQVEDVLTREWTGIKNGAGYSSWSDLTSTSSAKYSGNSAGSNDAIQLRSSNSNSGIVTTVSGGKVKKIIVEWQGSTANGRTLNVYGKNGAYTDPTDLYDKSEYGTKLGTIVKGTSTELEITGNYTYVGLRSNSGAMYITSITIIWENESNEPVSETWGSLYLPVAIDIPEDVKAYIVTGAGSDYVSLTQITGALPENTGIIYNGAWTPDFYAEVVNDEADVTGNLLKGTLAATYITEEAYVLAKVDGEVGFYKAQMNQNEGTAWLNNGFKAYLPANAVPEAAQGASGFKFRFETTGVEQVEVAKGVKAIYDLSGRKVNDMKAPGLYIVNGKKVLVK
ncbi:MAG: FN3 associated domain-containing protein [Prevotellamassilia sp.]|nr:FN3 associated domain-containing protein [Prevotellamassilia sp.]